MNRKIVSLITAALLLTAGCSTGTAKSTSVAASEKTAFKGNAFVDAEYVKNNLKNDKVIFVDARGQKAVDKTGAVPGAVVMTWQEIADVADKKPGDTGWGHIPDKDVLAKKLGESGLDKNKEIVLYSNANAGWGEDGRIMWELKAAGYKNLKMVDGGIEAIKKAGVELTKEISKPAPVNVTIDAIDYKNTIDTDTLTKDFAKYKIVDSREKDEYDGAVKYGEAKGGHIKGAVNIPYSSLYTSEGMLKSNSEIEEIFRNAGLNKDSDIVTYCTGGIRSAFMQLMLEELGYTKVRNYEGSYYNWAAVNEVEK